jgi:hypothetical protein
MSPQRFANSLPRQLTLVTAITIAGALAVRAQEAGPPAYLALVQGQVTLERDGQAEPAVQNMPLVPGDRLRTAAGRAEIIFPDGSGIEVGEYSEVEAVSSTRVRLIAGTLDHIQRPAVNSRSAAYLPPDLQTYGGTFDQYGSWQYDSPYGYVWYPTVAPDWRPYFYGAWSPIHSYGWTWIGRDAWAWPTHHYGRWGYERNTWFWIPGRTWGAAWVSWSFADDYVSWCPLGYDSRPVFAFSAGYRRAWDHWTMPRRTFEARGYAHDYRVGSRESVVGSREAVCGSRAGRLTTNDRRPTTTLNDRRTTTSDYRSPSTDSRVRATTSQAVAVPRAAAPARVYMPPPSYRGRERPRGNDMYAPPTPQRAPALSAASGGAVAVRRDYQRPTTDHRAPTTAYRPPTVDYRPATTDYRRPTADYGPRTMGSLPRREAPAPASPAGAASGGASASRSMPHERAAPPGGQARPRAEGRPAESRRPRS